MTTTTNLDELKARHQYWQATNLAAQAELVAAVAATDPRAVGLARTRRNYRAQEAAQRRYAEALKAAKITARKAAAAKRRFEQARTDATTSTAVHIEDIKPGDLVRIRNRGWIKVRRVNRTTITGEHVPPYDPPRYKFDRIVEHQPAPKTCGRVGGRQGRPPTL